MSTNQEISNGANGKFFTIFIDGVEYQIEESSITGGEIMDLGSIPRADGLIVVLDDGTQESIGVDDVVELKPGRRFKKAPRFNRGHEVVALSRLEVEMGLLKIRYGKIDSGENLDWFVVKEFRIPQGWNSELVELLVLIPAGYPVTAPDNFFVRNGLRTAKGAVPGNYSESQSVLGSTWAQFSYHVQDWNPSPSIEDGDSLLTYMLGVEKRLSEVN